MHRTGLTSLEKGAPGQSSSAWCCPSLLGGWGSSPLDQQIEGEVSVETRPRESPYLTAIKTSGSDRWRARISHNNKK
eukprot:1157467-Pelagomonas_calceolata.AAC.6